MTVLVLLLTNIEFRDVEDFSSLYHILSFHIVFKRICSPSGRYKFRAQEPVRKAKLKKVQKKSICIKNTREFHVFGLKINSWLTTTSCLFRDMNCSPWNNQFCFIIGFFYPRRIFVGFWCWFGGLFVDFSLCLFVLFCCCSFKQIFSQTSNTWSQ